MPMGRVCQKRGRSLALEENTFSCAKVVPTTHTIHHKVVILTGRNYVESVVAWSSHRDNDETFLPCFGYEISTLPTRMKNCQ